MIDLHIEISFAGNALLPSEAIALAKASGFKAVGLVAKVDQSNYKETLVHLENISKSWLPFFGVEVVVGVLVTHMPPQILPEVVSCVRSNGAQFVFVQGESVLLNRVQVAEVGTNCAAIGAGVDAIIGAGMLSVEDAEFAAERNVCIELTARSPSSLYNGHIVTLFRKFGFPIMISCGFSTARDFLSPEGTQKLWEDVGLGAGLNKKDLEEVKGFLQTWLQKKWCKQPL